MADWNNPQTGQEYVNHFAAIRDKDNALAKMFDGTSETNLPDGAIKINSGSKYRIEKWDASASSWNTVIPGLGNLTQGEVDQLANIDSTTISSTQWGYLGNLDQNLRTTDSPDFGGVAISSTQYSYLGGLGSAPLEDDDLAANGGQILQANQDETVPGEWEFTGSEYRFVSTNTRIQLADPSAPTGSGAVDLRVFSTDNGTFRIQGRGFFGGTANSTGLRFKLDNGAMQLGTPSGGWSGPHTFNAEALYDNGNRVYSASNAPASTDLSDHESQVVELGGDFDSGEEVKVHKIGDFVSIVWGNLDHSNTSSPTSESNVLPTQFRPNVEVRNVFVTGLTGVDYIVVSTSGEIKFIYRSWDGSSETKTGTAGGSLAYNLL